MKYIYLAITTTLISMLIYILYRLSVVYNFEKNEHYFNYILIIFPSIVFFLTYFFLTPKNKIYFNIIFFSTTIALLTFETKVFIAKKKYNKIMTSEEKPIIEIYKKINNPNLHLNFFPSSYIYSNKFNDLFILGGLSNREVLTCYENNQFQIIKTDRYGFNNNDNEWDKKNIKYFFVGDSYAAGHCVENNHNIVGNFYKIEKLDNQTGIINAAKGGVGPLISLSTIREYMPYNVENLIYVYDEDNDLSDIMNELNNLHLDKYLKDNNFKQNLAKKQNLINEKILDEQKNILLNYKKKIINKNNYLDIIKFRNTKIAIINNLINYNKNIITLEKVLGKIKIEAERKKVKNIYVVYLPAYSRYKNNDNKKYKQYSTVVELIKKNNMKIIDLRDFFLKYNNDPKQLWMSEFGHLTKYGFEVISSEIHRQIY